jgi:hypothetical protein
LLDEEIREYFNVAQTVQVIPDIFILNPYGGTRVCERAGKNAWDISEFCYPYPNVWNGKNAEMLWLELLRLTVAPVLSAGGTQMGLFLLEYAAHCAFGNASPSASAITGEMRMMADSFTTKVASMNLGSESSLEEWQKHIRELYLWGLMMSTVVQNPGVLLDFGIESLVSYVSDNDILSDFFERDLGLITSKDLSETWYERWAVL